MQEEALNCLQALRNKNKHKALIISATGTGKTILCALDVKIITQINSYLLYIMKGF